MSKLSEALGLKMSKLEKCMKIVGSDALVAPLYDGLVDSRPTEFAHFEYR